MHRLHFEVSSALTLKRCESESEVDRWAPGVILMSSESVLKHLSKPIFV